MSELKQKVVFEQHLNMPKHDDTGLVPGQSFDSENGFTPASEADSQAIEQAVETAVLPKKKRWGFRSLIVGGLGLAAWQGVDTVWNAWQGADWLTLGWGALVAAGAGMGLAALTREFLALRRLRNRQTEKDVAQELADNNEIGKARPFCEKLAKQSMMAESAHFERWQQQVKPAHADREVLEIYEHTVLSCQDEKARKLVARYASDSALMVAISPLAVADMLLVAWRNLRMLEQISRVYGVELGYWARIRLLRLVFVNMALAGATELVADAGMDLLSMNLAGKMSTRLAQGVGVGLLTARLGLKAIALMRPLPWLGDEPPKLSEFRRQLLRELRQKED